MRLRFSPWPCRACVLLCVVGACTAGCELKRFGLGPGERDAGVPDAAHDSGLTGDAGVDSGADDAAVADSAVTLDASIDAGDIDSLAWGPPVLVSAVSSPDFNDDDPSLTEDGLEMFFNSDRNGGFDIYTTRRAALDQPWGPPTPVTELNDPAFDTTPFVAAAGVAIWFASERAGRSNEIFVASRATRSDPWGTPRRIGVLNSSGSDASPAVLPGRLRMVMDSDRGGTFDLYESVRSDGRDPWGTPALLAPFASTDHNVNPVLSRSGLRLYFASDRAGGMGDDIWTSTRPSVSAPFSAPTQVTEVSSVDDDDDPWLSLDGRFLYFTSDRAGTDDIYVSSR